MITVAPLFLLTFTSITSGLIGLACYLAGRSDGYKAAERRHNCQKVHMEVIRDLNRG